MLMNYEDVHTDNRKSQTR